MTDDPKSRRGMPLSMMLAVLAVVLVAFGCIALSLQSRTTADKSSTALSAVQGTLISRCQDRSSYDLTIHDYLTSQVTYYRSQIQQNHQDAQLNRAVVAALPPQLAQPIKAAQQRALAALHTALVQTEKAQAAQVGGDCSQFR